MLCSRAEAHEAVSIANEAFAQRSISVGARVELGLRIMLAALAVLPPANRAEMIDVIQGELEGARGPRAVVVPMPRPMPPARQAELLERAAAG